MLSGKDYTEWKGRTVSDDWHAAETYKSMVAIGVESIKALLFLNGGAIVALLAYAGQAEKNGSHVARLLSFPVALFVAGVTLALLSFLTVYQTQYTLFNEREAGTTRHMQWQRATVVIAILSLVSFSTGAVWAIRSMANSN